MKLLVIGFVLLFARTGAAFETLNYDCSVWQLPDVEQAMNAETNQRIERALAEQNSCDQSELYRSLEKHLAQAWVDNLETWADAAPLARCAIPVSQSVYQDFSITDSPIGLAAGLKSVINIGGVYVGTDKLSHFMTEGFEYFTKVKRGASVADVLNQGLREENGIYGILATGIRSYGDMAANYFGFRFWGRVVDGTRPLIACQRGVWSLQRKFEWRDYVNDSFDESVNCNEYKTPQMEKSVDARTAILRRKAAKTPLRCPLKPDSCSRLSKELPASALTFLLSKRCRVPPTN